MKLIPVIILSVCLSQPVYAGLCMSRSQINISIDVGDIGIDIDIGIYTAIKGSIQKGLPFEESTRVAKIANSTQFGPPLLLLAIRHHNLEAVQTLLRLGADPNLMYGGKTLLLLAQKRGNPEIIQAIENAILDEVERE